jgi:hypothetical protein
LQRHEKQTMWGEKKSLEQRGVEARAKTWASPYHKPSKAASSGP